MAITSAWSATEFQYGSMNVMVVAASCVRRVRPEQTIGSDQEHDQHQRESHRVAVVRAEVTRYQRLGHAEEQPDSEDAFDMPVPADEHANEGLQTKRQTHERRRLSLAERDRDAGYTGHRR